MRDDVLSTFKNLLQHLAVVEVVLDTLNFLIVLVPLPGHEHHIAALRKGAGCANGFPAVGNLQAAGREVTIQAFFHLPQDFLGILIARIVAGENHPVAAQRGLARHER